MTGWQRDAGMAGWKGTHTAGPDHVPHNSFSRKFYSSSSAFTDKDIRRSNTGLSKLHWCTESRDYDPTAMLLAVTFSSPQADLWSDQDFATWLLTLRAGSSLLGVTLLSLFLDILSLSYACRV